MKKRTLILTIAGNIILAGLIVGTVIACDQFSPVLTSFFPVIGGTEKKGTQYSEYKTEEELQKAREDISYEIMSEGAVLLRNENNALPLNSSAKVSVFGQHAHEILASGSGSGSIGNPVHSLKEVLENSGFSVNGELWDFYLNNGGKSLGNGPALAGGNSTTDWSINECPLANYPSSLSSSYTEYNDAAIIVISRTGGEGGDLPRDMSQYGGKSNEHYLELSQEEKDMLTLVTGSFSKTVVLLNTNNVFETGFLKDYGIDACLYIGGVGMSGMDAIGDILKGEVCPSGHLADTYAYDDLSSPAMQNFGDYSYSNNTDYKYVDYAEGIYVGYRYYETRYADKIMGFENVGNYDYDTTVAYPFGYGLSYTTFEWSNFTKKYDSESDSFVFTIDVKNTGNIAGKDVVQLYVNAPYDQSTSTIEKPFVKLVGFAKTKKLDPQSSENITISVSKRELASYDEAVNKTYVVDNGTYEFALATNAHEATNSVLKNKGYSVAAEYDFTYDYVQDTLDATSYSKDSNTGVQVGNLFEDASYEGFKTLSRKNWRELDSGITRNLTLSDSDLAKANLRGVEASLNPNVKEDVGTLVTNNGKDVSLSNYVGKDYDDPAWDDIVQAVKKSDLKSLFSTAGYATMGLDYIGKPRAVDSDGPAGLQSFVGGASSVKAYGYPTESLLACSYNMETAKKMGEIVGEDSLHGGVNGWYAPGMDTHRTPFGGRNFEYYSEDGLLAGKMGANVVQGAKSKGLYCFIKHFALNEQDTNRGQSLHTWASEQAMREIYLKPFEISVKEGKTTALMTSLNCIGVTPANGHYYLITKLLKEEWGFEGMVITDYLGFDEQLMMQTLFAGGDAMLSTYGKFTQTSDATVKELQRACKNILYTVANSNAMYGISKEDVKNGFPSYILIEITVIIVFAAGIIVMDLLVFKPWRLIKKKNKEENK